MLLSGMDHGENEADGCASSELCHAFGGRIRSEYSVGWCQSVRGIQRHAKVQELSEISRL